MFIIHGYEFATQRVPVFLKTFLSARTVPVHLHIFGDDEGLRGFKETWYKHVVPQGLKFSRDTYLHYPEHEWPPIIRYMDKIHPSCHAFGYGYLFEKVLAGELLPYVDRLIILDPDTVVLGDIAELWATFDHFKPRQLISMAVDQSDRYYHRLQNPEDSAYSRGWAGVPHTVGVNGGVILLHAYRARETNLASYIAELTHTGAAEREAGNLDSFCNLAEQDALNLAIARRPHIWKPLDCVWNYMATAVDGHRLVVDSGAKAAPLNFYDVCTEKERESWEPVPAPGPPPPSPLTRCSCGQRVKLLHFAGGVRLRPELGLINQTVWGLDEATLQELVRLRLMRPDEYYLLSSVDGHDKHSKGASKDDNLDGQPSIAVPVDAHGHGKDEQMSRARESGMVDTVTSETQIDTRDDSLFDRAYGVTD